MSGDFIVNLKKLYERNPLAIKIVHRIRDLAKKLKKEYDIVKVMDFCGTHEWTITHYGIRSLMPDNVELVAGPGCPVCITPAFYVDQLIKLSFEGVSVLTYGDAFRLRGTGVNGVYSLEEAKSAGGRVEVVYSVLDGIKLALNDRSREYVFFAIGFETTMPSTASPLARGTVSSNFSFKIAHRFTPPVVKYLFDNVKGTVIHGVIAPGHVSTIIGSRAWEFIARDYNVPVVVAGFEPLDVLIAIMEILKQLITGKVRLYNEYNRVVRPEGNVEAKKLINKVFNVYDSLWRGIGVVPESGALLKEEYASYDANYRYGLKEPENIDIRKEIPPGCKCHEIVLGLSKPTDCPLFMKKCTPQTPYGPCMVSIEGTCRIWAEHGGAILLKSDVGI